MSETVTVSKFAYDNMVTELRELRSTVRELSGQRSGIKSIGDVASFAMTNRYKLTTRARKSIVRAATMYPPEMLITEVPWDEVRNCGPATINELKEVFWPKGVSDGSVEPS